MLYHTRLSHSAVVQDEIILLENGEGGNGMGAVTRLYLVHHHKGIPLRDEPLDVFAFYLHKQQVLSGHVLLDVIVKIVERLNLVQLVNRDSDLVIEL